MIGLLRRAAVAAVGATLCMSCGGRSEREPIKTPAPANGAFKPLAIGDGAPVYNAVTFAGDSVHLGRVGEPLTVLNIWATWCVSCREELSDLEALHNEFKSRGIRVLAVSVDESDAARVRRFIAAEKVSLGVVHDADGVVQQRYQVVGIPQTFVIGTDGRILWKSTGSLHGVADSLRRVLNAIK